MVLTSVAVLNNGPCYSASTIENYQWKVGAYL
jgi:hypothetical protein